MPKHIPKSKNGHRSIYPKAYVILFLVFLSVGIILSFILNIGYDDETLRAHFSPKEYGISFTDSLLRSFLSDLLCLSYYFAFSFTSFGRILGALLVSYRAFSFGRATFSVFSAFLSSPGLLSPVELILFFLSFTAVHSVVLRFTLSCGNFQKTRIKSFPPCGTGIVLRIKDLTFDLIFCAGISVLVKCVYTLIISII